MTFALRATGLVVLASLAVSCESGGPSAGPTQSPVQTQSQTPAPPEPPSPAPEPSTFVYSGIVTDGQGRPVAGATVRGGPNTGSTDANGHYEFQSQYSSVPGNVYPPTGYERKPPRFTDSFVLTPGQNITIRRITSLTIDPGTTMLVGERRRVSTQVTFDTGAVELPVLEIFELSSSDSSIIRAGSGSAENDRVTIEGVSAGIAAVTGRYFGASSAPKHVQVVR